MRRASDRRPSRDASAGRRGIASRHQSEASLDQEANMMLPTRAELVRRTKERSRLAAAKLAEEHDKEREQRQAAAARKSLALALASQARAENAVRSSSRRENMSAATEGGGGGRSRSPRRRSASHSAAYTRPRSNGTVPSTSAARVVAPPPPPAAAGERSYTFGETRPRGREQNLSRRLVKSAPGVPAPVRSSSARGSGVSRSRPTLRPRALALQPPPRKSQRLGRQGSERAAVVEGDGAVDGRRRSSTGRVARERSCSSESGARRSEVSLSRSPKASDGASRRARASEPPLPSLKRRAVSAARGAGVVAAAADDGACGDESTNDGFERNPRVTRSSRSPTRAAAGDVNSNLAIRGSRRGTQATPVSPTRKPSSPRPRSNSCGEAKQVDDEEEQAKRAKEEQYLREHKRTLAYMARQRKVAMLEKRKAEEEKTLKAEKLRRALQKLESDRRQSISLPPLRSHSRENISAGSSSRRSRVEGSNNGTSSSSNNNNNTQNVGSNGGSLQGRPRQGRASSARRGATSAASTHTAAARAPGTGAADSARPAWINVADGTAQPGSPEDMPKKRSGARVLRRDVSARAGAGDSVTAATRDKGKENAGRGRGLQREGVLLRRNPRPQQERASLTGGEAGQGQRKRGRAGPGGSSQRASSTGVAGMRVATRRDKGPTNSAADHPPQYGRVSGSRRGKGGGAGPRITGRRRRAREESETWTEDGDVEDEHTSNDGPDGLAWMEATDGKSEPGHEEEKAEQVSSRQEGRDGDGKRGVVGHHLETGKRVNPEAPRRESEGGTGGLLDGRHLEENGEEVLSLEVAADAGRDTDAVAVVQPTNGIPGTVSENQQQQQQGQHDRLPDMLESLDRVTKTVNDLKGRCRQLSLVMDARDEYRATTSRREVTTNDNDSNRAPEPEPLRLEGPSSRTPAAEWVPPHDAMPPPPRLEPEQMRGTIAALRPTITVPTPVTHPRRQPPPILRPTEDSPRELAPPSSSSPAISFAGSPNFEAGAGRGGNRDGQMFVVPPGLFTPSPGIPLGDSGEAPGREERDGEVLSPPWRRVARQTARVINPPALVRDADPLPSPARGGPDEDGGGGKRRASWLPLEEEGAPGDGRQEHPRGRSSSSSRLDAAVEVFRSGIPPARGVGASEYFVPRQDAHQDGVSGALGGWGRSDGVGVPGVRDSGGFARPATTGGRASSSSGMPSWSEWVARVNGNSERKPDTASSHKRTVAEAHLTDGIDDGSGSEEGGMYPSAFSMSGLVAEAIAMDRNSSRTHGAAGATSSSGGLALADGAPPEQLQAENRSRETAASATAPPGSDGHNPRDLWDSLLERGPAISPGRSRFRLQESQLSPADVDDDDNSAVGGADSTSETSPAQFESSTTPNIFGSRGDRSNGGGGRGTAVPTMEQDSAPGLSGVEPDGGREDESTHQEGRSRLPAGKDSPVNPTAPTAGGAEAGVRIQSEERDAGLDGHQVGTNDNRRRRLAPAELQSQLMNELQLHEDLQDAEMQADGLLAAATVEEARQRAHAAALLLGRERAQAESIVRQQALVYEDALARNDAVHEARLQHERALAEEQAATRADAVTSTVTAAVMASLGAQGRQAVAAVAAVAAAGAHAQSQQATAMAMAAQAAVVAEVQEGQADGLVLDNGGDAGAAARGDEGEGQHRIGQETSTGRATTAPRKPGNDFDSLLDSSPLLIQGSLGHTPPLSGHGRSGFWVASPDKRRKPQKTDRRQQHRSRRGEAPRPDFSPNRGDSGRGRNGSGISFGVAREQSLSKRRHSYGGFGSTAVAGSVPAGRRQRSRSLGPSPKRTERTGGRAGEGLRGQGLQELRRSSDSVGGGCPAVGRASVEYEAVRREILREREAISRRTQQQLRDLEAEGEENRGGRGVANDVEGKLDGDVDKHCSSTGEPHEEEEGYSSFGSRFSDGDGENVSPESPHQLQANDWTEDERNEGGLAAAKPPSPGLLVSAAGVRERREDGPNDEGSMHGDGDHGEVTLRLEASLIEELQESVVSLAAAGHPRVADIKAARMDDLESGGRSEGSILEVVGDDQVGEGDFVGSSASVVSDEVDADSYYAEAVDVSLIAEATDPRALRDDENAAAGDAKEGGDLHAYVHDEFSSAHEVADQVTVDDGTDLQSHGTDDVEDDCVSARDSDDEVDRDEGCGSDLFEVKAAAPQLVVDVDDDTAAEVVGSVTATKDYSTLVTPPATAEKHTPPRSSGGECRRHDTKGGQCWVEGDADTVTSRPRVGETPITSVELPPPSVPSKQLQWPNAELNLEDGQKELDRLMRQAAAVRTANTTAAQDVSRDDVDNEAREDNAEDATTDTLKVDRQQHQQTLTQTSEVIQSSDNVGSDNKDSRTSAVTGGVDPFVAAHALVADGQDDDKPLGSRLDGSPTESCLIPPRDLLSDGEYTSIEPAEPPSLSEWISMEASDGRLALSTIAEATVDCSASAGVASVASPSRGDMETKSSVDDDVEEDSFGSGDDFDDGSDGGGAEGEEDSEAELAALVAKIAVRGAESRGALIVQALARGRKARKMAAAARGRRAAEEVSLEGPGVREAGTREKIIEQDSGNPVRDMEWLTRKMREEGLSDSFASSEGAEDTTMPAAPEWPMPAESEVESADNAAKQEHVGGSREDVDVYKLTLSEGGSPQDSVLHDADGGLSPAVSALQQYDTVETALSPADGRKGRSASLRGDGEKQARNDVMEEFDHVEPAVSPTVVAEERGDEIEGAGFFAPRFGDGGSSAAVRQPLATTDTSASAAEIDDGAENDLSPAAESVMQAESPVRTAEQYQRYTAPSVESLDDPASSAAAGQLEGEKSIDVGGLTDDSSVRAGAVDHDVEEQDDDDYVAASFEMDGETNPSTAADDVKRRVAVTVETRGAAGEGESSWAEENRLFSPGSPVASLPDLAAEVGGDLPSTDEGGPSSTPSWQRLVLDYTEAGRTTTHERGGADEAALERTPTTSWPESCGSPLVTPRAPENRKNQRQLGGTAAGGINLLASYEYLEDAEGMDDDSVVLFSPSQLVSAEGAGRTGSFPADHDYVESADSLPRNSTREDGVGLSCRQEAFKSGQLCAPGSAVGSGYEKREMEEEENDTHMLDPVVEAEDDDDGSAGCVVGTAAEEPTSLAGPPSSNTVSPQVPSEETRFDFVEPVEDVDDNDDAEEKNRGTTVIPEAVGGRDELRGLTTRRLSEDDAELASRTTRVRSRGDDAITLLHSQSLNEKIYDHVEDADLGGAIGAFEIVSTTTPATTDAIASAACDAGQAVTAAHKNGEVKDDVVVGKPTTETGRAVMVQAASPATPLTIPSGSAASVVDGSRECSAECHHIKDNKTSAKFDRDPLVPLSVEEEVLCRADDERDDSFAFLRRQDEKSAEGSCEASTDATTAKTADDVAPPVLAVAAVDGFDYEEAAEVPPGSNVVDGGSSPALIAASDASVAADHPSTEDSTGAAASTPSYAGRHGGVGGQGSGLHRSGDLGSGPVVSAPESPSEEQQASENVEVDGMESDAAQPPAQDNVLSHLHSQASSTELWIVSDPAAADGGVAEGGDEHETGRKGPRDDGVGLDVCAGQTTDDIAACVPLENSSVLSSSAGSMEWDDDDDDDGADGRKTGMNGSTNGVGSFLGRPAIAAAFTADDRADLAQKPRYDKQQLVDSITDELMDDLIGRLLGSPAAAPSGAPRKKLPPGWITGPSPQTAAAANVAPGWSDDDSSEEDDGDVFDAIRRRQELSGDRVSSSAAASVAADAQRQHDEEQMPAAQSFKMRSVAAGDDLEVRARHDLRVDRVESGNNGTSSTASPAAAADRPQLDAGERLGSEEHEQQQQSTVAPTASMPVSRRMSFKGDEWGRAQLSETIANEGGIMIAGEEGREDDDDLALVSADSYQKVVSADPYRNAANDVDDPGSEGDEGWGRSGVNETHGNDGRLVVDTATAHVAPSGGEEGDGVGGGEGASAIGGGQRLGGDDSGVMGDAESADEDDEYYFDPAPIARPKKPWAALAGVGSTPSSAVDDAGRDNQVGGGYDGAEEKKVSFGVRTGGGGDNNVQDSTDHSASPALITSEILSPIPEEGAEEGSEEGSQDLPPAASEILEKEGSGDALVETEQDDGRSFMEELVMEYPEFPWWPVLAATIEAALGSMSLDELNDRMAMHAPSEEPYVEELDGPDTLEYPPPDEVPLEHEAAIPARVIDKLFNESNEEAMLGIREQLPGVPLPDRDSIDSARWMAFDAANEYLAEKRSERRPRRACDGPNPDGKVLHRMPGFRHFRSMEHAVVEVTEAVLGQDGACLPGREPNPDFVEMLPLDKKPESWVHHEDDLYFVKCKLAEEILEHLVDDTVAECKTVFALKAKARQKWSKWLAGQMLRQRNDREA